MIEKNFCNFEPEGWEFAKFMKNSRTEYVLLWLVPGEFYRSNKCQLDQNNWDAETYTNKLEMVFCYQNCSDLLWEKIILFSDREKILKFGAEGWEFAKYLRSLEQFIQTVKGQNNFL